MKTRLLAIVCCVVAQSVWADPVVKTQAESMSDAQKYMYCQRIRDHALQNFYNRVGGRPMTLFTEDGSDGPRIINTIIRQIYADKTIVTPNQAETFGRNKCNEMMGTKNLPKAD